MIKKLQHKFVLVNMILVSSVFIFAFVLVCISSYHKMQFQTANSLERILQDDGKLHSEKVEIGLDDDDRILKDSFDFLFSFCVIVNEDGTIKSVHSQDIQISDAVLNKVVAYALNSSKLSGSIHSLNFEFSKEKTANGYKIAFIDTSEQYHTLRNLIFTLLIVGAFGLLAFFFISVYLARWIIRPVKQAWEQQQQFVADASHELKTPLTVILANTGIILNHKQDTIASQEKWIQYIKTESERMKKLVEDLLFLAKSDEAKLPCTLNEVNMSDVIWSCILPFESVAFEQKIILNTQITPNIMIQGNESQLKQLIGILLDNACKYANENGSVTIRFTKHQEHGKLTIHNTGSYICESHRKLLFERFYRTDESRDRKEGGYGLGLAIAKSIVTNHHGKINVFSKENDGTTFEIIL